MSYTLEKIEQIEFEIFEFKTFLRQNFGFKKFPAKTFFVRNHHQTCRPRDCYDHYRYVLHRGQVHSNNMNRFGETLNP